MVSKRKKKGNSSSSKILKNECVDSGTINFMMLIFVPLVKSNRV